MTLLHTRRLPPAEDAGPSAAGAAAPALWLASARAQHLVGGASPERGGDGTGWLAAELLLAALSGCATAIVGAAAAERGWPLAGLAIEAESVKDPQRAGHYDHIRLAITGRGVTPAQLQALVDVFQAECPIYGTLSRGTTLRVSVTALPAQAPA